MTPIPRSIRPMYDAICATCAERLGGRWPKWHGATWWEATCDECGEERACCARGDWLWWKEKNIPSERWD